MALVLEGPSPSGELKGDVLNAARRLHPDAKRGLMIAWGQWGQEAAGEAIFASMAHGVIDHFCSGPGDHPTSCFTRRSRACCSNGRRRARELRIPSRSSERPGRAGRMSSERHSSAALSRTRSTSRTRRRESESSRRPAMRAGCRWWRSRTARSWRTPRTLTWRARPGRLSTWNRSSSTSSSSAPDPRASRRPSTALPRGSTRSSWTRAGSAARQPPARSFAIISDFPAASAAGASPSRHTTRLGSSARSSRSCTASLVSSERTTSWS